MTVTKYNVLPKTAICVLFTPAAICAGIVTGHRLVVIFQETARNHIWEAGMLMQSYMLQTVK